MSSSRPHSMFPCKPSYLVMRIFLAFNVLLFLTFIIHYRDPFNILFKEKDGVQNGMIALNASTAPSNGTADEINILLEQGVPSMSISDPDAPSLEGALKEAEEKENSPQKQEEKTEAENANIKDTQTSSKNITEKYSDTRPQNEIKTDNTSNVGNDLLSVLKTRYRASNPHATDPDDPDPMIYISSATDVQPDTAQWMPEGTKSFDSCVNLEPWMKCHYTSNDSVSTVNRSHTILFHTRHMYWRQWYQRFKGLPKVRRPSQKWIFYESEPPTNVWNYADQDKEYWKLFNLTSTFTSDSDIPVQYHKVKCTPKDNWKPTGRNYAQKDKPVAWFVSHCSTSSKRELYVKELQKYIPVDIYGNCGNATVCSKNGTALKMSEEECMFELLNKHYRFYLSFENAFCAEYVTEKFHRIVKAVDVVPVVLGAVDYANILPEGSYIDVRDFKSPKSLAKFLKSLAKNDTLYNDHIEKKKAVDCTYQPHFACLLCEYLHLHRYEKQIVYDAASFWSVEQRCTSPKDFYRGVADEIIPKITYEHMPDLFL